MMKKKLLFIAPNYYGFNDVIYDGLCAFSEYDCTMVVSATTEKYKYKNFYARLENFFYKIFLNQNLKTRNKLDSILNQINAQDRYDITVINRPDILDQQIYNLLDKKGGKMIAVYWDSFKKIAGQQDTLPHFDLKYSFDTEDCKKFGLEKINNFYFNPYSGNSITAYDVVYIGTLDKRFNDLQKIIQYLNGTDFKIGSFLYNPIDFEVPAEFSENVIKLKSIIPFKESHEINAMGNIILDIAHENQTGLSFRPFEALGDRKKLITTNSFIKKYDFYNPINIFVIEDIDKINIPPAFFKTPYIQLSDDLYEKYSLKNWLKTVTAI